MQKKRFIVPCREMIGSRPAKFSFSGSGLWFTEHLIKGVIVAPFALFEMEIEDLLDGVEFARDMMEISVRGRIANSGDLCCNLVHYKHCISAKVKKRAAEVLNL